MINENDITSTIYRYEALLQAIDFFTQRFNLDYLSEFAFEFTNEILTLNSSALFLREGNDYILKKKRYYTYDDYTITGNLNIHDIACLHGNVITSGCHNFFNNEDINAFSMELVIPLIIDDYLFGFIVSDGKSIGSINCSDITIAQSLMRLFNNSLENSKIFADLKSKNKVLDEKIFNLFAINQSVRILLSQIDLQSLYTMSIDIFSEMTGSRVTSIGIYDEKSHCIKIQGYRNISTYTTYYTEFQLYSRKCCQNKIIFNVEEDQEILKAIFVNYEEFKMLDAKYVVLIMKDELLGLITLSDSVLPDAYNCSVFELLETLTNFTYIALSNAILFQKLKEQKELVEKKFTTLSNLNKLVKNINGCETLDELCHLTLHTLRLSFFVKKSFILLKKDVNYGVQNSIGLDSFDHDIIINNCWKDALMGDCIYDFQAISPQLFFDDQVVEWLGETNCIVIAPIHIVKSSLGSESCPMGFLVVVETNECLQDEEVLLIDTISKNISPIIYHMKTMLELKKDYIEDPKAVFLSALKEKIIDFQTYEVEFELYYKKIEQHPFKSTIIPELEGADYYKIDNYVFVITYDNLDDYDFDKLPMPNSIEEFLDYDYV